MYDYLRTTEWPVALLHRFQWKKITSATRRRPRPPHGGLEGYLTADFPLHEAPLWIATAAGSGTARARCATSFTGGPTAMVQFVRDGFDTNLTC